MAFRLETFGGLAFLSSAMSDRVQQRQRLALLALLAASERGLSRDQIIGFLWPDKPDESARHSLDQLLYALRRALGSSVFKGGDPLQLNDAVVTSDVSEFARYLERGALADACALYRGPFLDGFFLGNGSEFEEWLESTRSRLATQHRSALAQLASEASAAGHLGDAVRWWRDLSAADPLSGRVALGLMRALVAVGDRAAALQHARVHETLLR